MFKLFTRRQPAPTHSLKDKTAAIIVRQVLRLQASWALFMQRQANKLPDAAKKWLLLICCLLSVGYCLLTLKDGCSARPKKSLAWLNTQRAIVSPRVVPALSPPAALIPEALFRKIHRFRVYMDSLAYSGSGKKIADSIFLARPGLMDSVLQLEKLYDLQLSEKK